MRTPKPCPHCAHRLSPSGRGMGSCPACGFRLVPGYNRYNGALLGWYPLDLVSYSLIEQVGQGGMGVVFKGREHAAERLVAVKFPLVGERWDKDAETRFEREISLLRSLHHPNVVRYFGHGTEEGLRYYVMEWIDGNDLRKELFECQARGDKYLPFNQVYPWFQQLCRARAGPA